MWRHALFTDIWRKTTPPGKTKNGFRDARRENGENGSHTLTHTHSHTHTHTHTLTYTHTHTLSLTSTLSHVHTCLVSIRSNSVWFGQVNFFELLAKLLLWLPMFSQSGFTCNASREARKYHRIGSLQKSIGIFSFWQFFNPHYLITFNMYFKINKCRIYSLMVITFDCSGFKSRFWN